MTRLWVLALLSVVLAAAASARSEPRFNFETTPCCLPKNVRPIAYRLELKPNLEKPSFADGNEDVEFTGKEDVDIEAFGPTDTITLNAVKIPDRVFPLFTARARARVL